MLSSQNSFLPPPKWVLILQSGSKHSISHQFLRQSAITPGVVRKIVQYFFFFPLNEPILQLECMNSRMFLSLYFIKRMGNIYWETFIIVLRNVITLNFSVLVFSLEFCYRPVVPWSEYCGHIYRLQMWIKMKVGIFKISDIEEDVIWLSPILMVFSSLLRGVDCKDGRLVGLITFSSLLLI